LGAFVEKREEKTKRKRRENEEKTKRKRKLGAKILRKRDGARSVGPSGAELGAALGKKDFFRFQRKRF